MAINIEESVRTFMTACGQGKDDGKYAFDLRLRLLEEEFNEFMEALDWGDDVFVAKEAADLVYVVVGTCISRGIPFNEVFAALQNSNMSKIGPDGTVTKREDGKILKGEHFQPAEDQIREILANG
jgi:predicted HAD superfamily Cof-like phosphohydrolase